MKAVVRVWGTSQRGIETREITVDMPEKSTKWSELDRYFDNLTYAIWDVMRIAKDDYGFEQITSHKLITLI